MKKDKHDLTFENASEIEQALLEATPTAEIPSGVKERLAAKVMGSITSESGAARPLPTRVSSDEGKWIELAPLAAAKILNVDKPSGISTYLVRMEPGANLPAHAHDGVEECYMLEGSCNLGPDNLLEAGDYEIAPSGSYHGGIYSEEGCLLLVRGIAAQHLLSAHA